MFTPILPDFSGFDASDIHYYKGKTASKPIILVVEDDLAVREQICNALQQESYWVRRTTSGKAAIEQCLKARPDLILMSSSLSDVNALDCCKTLTQPSRLRGQRQFGIEGAVPVVMLLSSEDETSVGLALAAGAIDCIAKPVSWALLRQRVRHILQVNRRINQLQIKEQQLWQRTIALEETLAFETTLRRISEQVHRSLDIDQILQIVVQELTRTFSDRDCSIHLFSPEPQQPYSPTSVPHSVLHRAVGWHSFRGSFGEESEIEQQITAVAADLEADLPHTQGAVQFCLLTPQGLQHPVSVLWCPLVAQERHLGYLCVVIPAHRRLSVKEVDLVQQVAHQCGIALQQALLHQEAQSQIAELEQLNHLKDDFLSTVSHELRSPISNMQLAIQMLERYLGHREPGQSAWGQPDQFFSHTEAASETCPLLPQGCRAATYLTILRNECDREMMLVNDLLDLQRLETCDQDIDYTLNFDLILLEDWLPQIVMPYAERATQRQQTLKLELAPLLPPLCSAPDRVQRILTELLHNACKYTPPHGSITLTAAPTAETIVFRITNTGAVIAPEESSRIFEKFYRIPGGDLWQQGGTGLGLALTKRLVEYLGGAIGVSSQGGETCFWVELPIGGWGSRE
ncbi:ATP-binding protein [Leptolyngbya ohadii]|uniref:ATP-binding protein n=1 Tax=Leptolyngbya ohadii TaxID=1962290 RepID=UPI000B59C6AF|nr:ATP-binding protein [Leptolyngbya ohadii]